MSIESVISSNCLIFCHPLLHLPSIFPNITVFSNESVLRIRWPKDWSFSFSISPSSEYSELISFRMDWLDLLAVQGILKSLLLHYSSKASILWCSAFFIVQLSYPYMTTGKTLSSHLFKAYTTEAATWMITITMFDSSMLSTAPSWINLLKPCELGAIPPYPFYRCKSWGSKH